MEKTGKFYKTKELIEEYNNNEDLISELKKTNHFLAIGYIYSSMEGDEKSFEPLSKKYSDKLIDVLTKRNQEIEKLINNE